MLYFDSKGGPSIPTVFKNRYRKFDIFSSKSCASNQIFGVFFGLYEQVWTRKETPTGFVNFSVARSIFGNQFKVLKLLKRQSHEIFCTQFFSSISSFWSHQRCPWAVLFFFYFSQSYCTFKTTPRYFGTRRVATPRYFGYRGVATPRCPKYRGVVTFFTLILTQVYIGHILKLSI